MFNPRAQMQANRNVDFDTVLWWMGQSKEAKAIFEECSHSGIEMKIALDNFISWLKKEADENILVWSNGAGFDVPIMENLLSSFRIPIPWKFYNIRCYRTLKMAKGIEKGIQRNGVKHSEIDDARHQAKCIMNLIQQEPCFEC